VKKKSKRRTPKRKWHPAPFSVSAEYKGYDSLLDRAIVSAMRRKHCDGSGYDFADNKRDLSFDCERRAAAIAAAKRVRKIRGVKAIVTGRVWP
jgi:hypothetical protein